MKTYNSNRFPRNARKRARFYDRKISYSKILVVIGWIILFALAMLGLDTGINGGK